MADVTRAKTKKYHNLLVLFPFIIALSLCESLLGFKLLGFSMCDKFALLAVLAFEVTWPTFGVMFKPEYPASD